MSEERREAADALRHAIEDIKRAEALLGSETPEDGPETPPSGPKGITLGIDISNHNPTLRLADAYAEGYRFVWILVSEGPYRDGTSFVNHEWPRQYLEARRAGFAIGLYMFAVETPPKPQVDLFLRQIAGQGIDLEDVGLAVDFERYGDPDVPNSYFYLTPSNATLEAIGDELRARVHEHPLGLYSSASFWDGMQSGTVESGKWSRYGFDYAWIAHWPANVPLENPKAYALKIPKAYSPFEDRLGGQAAAIGQVAVGKVANQNIDVDVFRGELEAYRELTTGTAEAPVKPAPTPDPKPEPEPKPDKDEWNPASPTGRLAPPGFVPQPPRPGDYTDRNPTRFIWRADVEKIVRDLYARFGKNNIFVNTYVHHPATIAVPRPNVSLDVWGGRPKQRRPGDRGVPLDPELGAEVFAYLFNMKGEPHIAWTIYHRRIYGNWSGYRAEPFGDGSVFTNHDDHIHLTYEGPFQQIS